MVWELLTDETVGANGFKWVKLCCHLMTRIQITKLHLTNSIEAIYYTEYNLKLDYLV